VNHEPAPAAAAGYRSPEPRDAWREEVERSLRAGTPVFLVLEAPDVAPEVLLLPNLELTPGWAPAVYWHNSHTTFGVETWVGLGVFAEAQANWGETEPLEALGRAWLPSMHTVCAGAAPLPPRVFNAVGFGGRERETVHPAPPWNDFDGAWACIPRLSYVTRRVDDGTATRACFCLTLSPGDVAALDELLSRVGALGRRLRGLSLRPGVPSGASAAAASSDHGKWLVQVERALVGLAQGEFDKVVAARPARLVFHREPSIAHTLAALAAKHPESTRFAFFRGPSVFLGATPERLITKVGLTLETAALAGTVWSQASDRGALDVAKRFGTKEYTEHSPVLDTIVSALRPVCSELTNDAVPEVCAQSHVFHLKTVVRGTLSAPTHVMSLVRRLHPTPAVAGRPTEAALKWIRTHETFERGLYAGPVGWFDAHGDGQFDVALRSGVIRGSEVTVFGGAGLVNGSEPAKEFDETAQKMQVLLGSVCFASDAPRG
jgi:menaquinone-specific isochorismate synthase